jgi:hypothetical protein
MYDEADPKLDENDTENLYIPGANSAKNIIYIRFR